MGWGLSGTRARTVPDLALAASGFQMGAVHTLVLLRSKSHGNEHKGGTDVALKLLSSLLVEAHMTNRNSTLPWQPGR